MNDFKVDDLDDIPTDRMIETTRIVPFTAEQVFSAFGNPDLLARWWGPNGFTNTFHEFNFCPKGSWRFTMHAPDGKEYLNDSRFVSIDAPRQIVLDHLCAPQFRARFQFSEHQSGCHIHWQMIFADAQTCANVAKFAGDANEQNIDRLTAVLSELSLHETDQ